METIFVIAPVLFASVAVAAAAARRPVLALAYTAAAVTAVLEPSAPAALELFIAVPLTIAPLLSLLEPSTDLFGDECDEFMSGAVWETWGSR